MYVTNFYKSPCNALAPCRVYSTWEGGPSLPIMRGRPLFVIGRERDYACLA
jgi:hypothetical protein